MVRDVFEAIRRILERIGRGSRELHGHLPERCRRRVAEARREANEILARAQKVAQETRDADIAATKAELERLRERAAAEIESEKQRAITELRNEVADLALKAASKVVGETLTGERERRLVEEFLAETTAPPGGPKS